MAAKKAGQHREEKQKSMAPYSWLIALVLIALYGLYLLVSGGIGGGSSSAPTDGEELRVLFIDVGQADAALVTCGGESLLIDGGNVADSSTVYTILEKNGVTHLDYIVCTHAHEDHVGGLSGALEACTAGTVYCPVTDYDSKAFRNFSDRVAEQNCELTVPKAGETFALGAAEVEILACDPEAEDTNNTSIVLRVSYGETSFLFMADAETPVERELLDAGTDLSATVLKVGHHGSGTSTSYRFLNEVMPAYAMISVGKDNSYGHPDEAVLSRLEDAGARILRTDELGDILFVSDGKTVTLPEIDDG